MGIPEDQLEIWSRLGSVTGSSQTYNVIKNALEAPGTPYGGKDFEVFLQGSYGNTTNIWAESDVDIVICLHDCFQSDRSELPGDQEQRWEAAHPGGAAYGHVEFKRDVLQVLRAQYGNGVVAGNKAIEIPASGNRRSADVIAAVEFKRYFRFNSLEDQDAAEGICFYDASGEQIANYPKQHSENMTTQHQLSGEMLKPMVRILKNARSRLVADGDLQRGFAPSYYLEGLMYNFPLDRYQNNYHGTLFNVLQWMHDTVDKTEWLCANRQYYLLRDDAPTCWQIANFDAFQVALVQLWNNWA